MAITSIEADIQNITGVADANSQFIISAQKFVVSSIPKNLLKWASTETVPSTHGGDNDPQQVTLPVGTDNIISVRRDSFSAMEVSVEERGFIDNNSSLKKATSVFPKYYIADGNRIIAKPDPDNTYKIYVMYIDFSKLDDDSDLRNAIIYRACSSEFGKLASAQNSAFETAITYMKAALDQAEEAGDKFEVANTASVFGDTATFDATNSQLTRVKDAMDKVTLLIETDKPASNYDAHDLLQSEDIELLQGNLSIVNAEMSRAQAHLQEWSSIGDMRIKQINSALSEAQGYSSEVSTRLSQSQNYLAQSNQYYQWATMEIKQYVESNIKTDLKKAATTQMATSGK